MPISWLTSASLTPLLETPASSPHITGLRDQFIESVGLCDLQPVALGCRGMEDGTGHNRLVKKPELCPTDGKRISAASENRDDSGTS